MEKNMKKMCDFSQHTKGGKKEIYKYVNADYYWVEDIWVIFVVIFMIFLNFPFNPRPHTHQPLTQLRAVSSWAVKR